MLRIRLARIGKKKQPYYRIVVSERARDTYGRALEILGSYNPRTKHIELKSDRIKHWLSVGAQASATAHNLFVSNKVIEGKKVTAAHIKAKKKTKKKESSSSTTKPKQDETTDNKEDKESQKVEKNSGADTKKDVSETKNEPEKDKEKQ